MNFDPDTYLKAIGESPDKEIDLGPAALALAALAQPGIRLERYFNHLKKLVEETASRHAQLLQSGAEDSVETRLAALKHILSDIHDYSGDTDTYDDLQNASLIRVIDRAKGLPVTLSILYMHVARGQGWDICGLDVPGHFICRLEAQGRRLIFDPFLKCKILVAHELRSLVKKTLGAGAELSSSYFEPTKNRDILIRLQNNIKFRQIETEDYDGALQTVESMRIIAPEENRLLFDAGVLLAHNNQPDAAIEVLENYIKRVPNDRERYEVLQILEDLKASLN